MANAGKKRVSFLGHFTEKSFGADEARLREDI